MSGGILSARQITHKINQAAARGVAEAARAIEATAVERAPIRDGDLRNSASTTAADNGMTQIIRFNIVYAAVQHEGDFNHPRGGQKEYLKSAMEDMETPAKLIIANHLKGIL